MDCVLVSLIKMINAKKGTGETVASLPGLGCNNIDFDDLGRQRILGVQRVVFLNLTWI